MKVPLFAIVITLATAAPAGNPFQDLVDNLNGAKNGIGNMWNSFTSKFKKEPATEPVVRRSNSGQEGAPERDRGLENNRVKDENGKPSNFADQEIDLLRRHSGQN